MGRRALIDFTPFARKRADSSSLADKLFNKHQKRIDHYRKLRRFYEGEHFAWDRGDDEPFVVENLCSLTVDTHVTALAKNGFRIKIPDRESTTSNETEEREFIRLALDDTWRANRRELVFSEMAEIAGISGDVFIRLSWETADPRQELPYVRYDVIDPEFVFPEFAGPGSIDGKKVESVLIVFPQYEDPIEYDDMSGLPRYRRGNEEKFEVRYYVERWYADRWYQYFPGQEPIERPNLLGEIPVVHIPNVQVAGKYYGRSDLHDIHALNEELNGRTTDVSDAVNYQGSPITVISGARVAQLERGANRMWGLPEGATAANLTLSGGLNDSISYIDRLEDRIFMLARIPKAVFGNLTDTSRTSGAALALRYQPLLDHRARKILTFTVGIQDINRLTIKILAQMDREFGAKLAKLDAPKYRTDIVFESPLPRDEQIELDKAKTRLELGLSSRVHELERQGYSRTEAERIIEEARAEREAEARMEFEFGQEMMAATAATDSDDDEEGDGRGNPDPERGNPDARGEAVSRSKTARPGE